MTATPPLRWFSLLAVLAGVSALVRMSAAPDPKAAEAHWAFQPVATAIPPAVPGAPGSLNSPVDPFILQGVRGAGLTASGPADRRTWLRRLSFDLTGLPPSPSDVEAFARDPDPTAAARWVDRYLASPHYGERWGRWWLDLARYADTNGQDENKVMANAWRYRDWVIRSFNDNQPFDQFIVWQLAGDLLPTNGVPEEVVLERWTATGLLVLGPKMLAEQDKPKLVLDLVDEQIDVVTRAFLGLTVGCARCHDHKFDPIPTRDYHAMAGIFRSTRAMENLAFVSKFNERPVSTQAHREALERHATALAASGLALTNAWTAAGTDLRARWREELAEAMAAGAPAEAVVGSPQVPPYRTRLKDALALDPATHPVSRKLREWQGRPVPEVAAFLSGLESDTASGSGLRVGPGRVGGAFVATGSNHLSEPHGPRLEPAALTVEAWVRTASFPGGGETRRWLVNKNGNEWVEGHYALVLDRDRPGAYLNIGGGRENVFSVWSDGPRLQTNRWHHLAMSHDGHVLRLFVDGQPAGETRVERVRVPGTGPLAIGSRQDGYVHFRGSLDEIRIHDRVLGTAEIAEHAAHPETAGDADAVARWDFNDLTPAEREQMALAEVRDGVFGPEGILQLPADPKPWFPSATRDLLDRLDRERNSLLASAPPPAAYALAVGEESPMDLPVYNRGNHLNPVGNPVPRGFLRVADRGGVAPPTAEQSGRLELARWLTSPDHPLTARVVVNRVWQAHFGEGLVRTPDNFGVRGETPTHPALLDWLAREFVGSGWDLKHLHRLILNSATYRQAASAAGPGETETATRDPDNRWLSHFPRQRLEAEMVRDALLAVSDRLDLTRGGSLVGWKNDEYAPEDTVSEGSVRRSVYLPVVRDRVYDVFTLFDFANPSVGTAKRTPTVVSHQALFFLNSPLVQECARRLAERAVSSASGNAPRLEFVYARLFGRSPSDAETGKALRFLTRAGTSAPAGSDVESWAALCQALLAANEFLYRE